MFQSRQFPRSGEEAEPENLDFATSRGVVPVSFFSFKSAPQSLSQIAAFFSPVRGCQIQGSIAVDILDIDQSSGIHKELYCARLIMFCCRIERCQSIRALLINIKSFCLTEILQDLNLTLFACADESSPAPFAF